MHRKAIFALVAAAAGCSGVQKDAPADPLEPTARTPALGYRSPFSEYQRYVEPEVAAWREVNDEVGRVGGHVGHAKPPAKGAGQR